MPSRQGLAAFVGSQGHTTGLAHRDEMAYLMPKEAINTVIDCNECNAQHNTKCLMSCKHKDRLQTCTELYRITFQTNSVNNAYLDMHAKTQ